MIHTSLATVIAPMLLLPMRTPAAQVQPSTEDVSDRTTTAVRDTLANARIRFTRTGKGRVAFLGGSITHMTNGWRSMVCQSLEKRFPKATFDFIDAGIPSTDSTLGAFRLRADVFGHGPVDLLFVEFAVNDSTNGRSSKESIRGMEGIIRQARQHNPHIDIVMLYFVDPPKMEHFRQGKTPPVIVSHEQVARHYNIPSINLAREVTDRIDAGEFDWKAFGGLHPAAFGHRVYARSIDRLLDGVWRDPLPEAVAIRPHRMPNKPLDPRNYSLGRYVDLNHAHLVKGWRRISSWTTRKGHTREGFVRVPMLIAEHPGAVLGLRFEGTAVGIVVVAGPDVGMVEFSIDDGPFRRLDQYTQWSSYLHIPWAYMLAADLERGNHALTLRTIDQKNPKSQGHAVRIVKFIAN
jgi:lysophospholipase L1-like esterase